MFIVAPAVCVAKCNCGCCVQQFASVSSSRGSCVQLEEHWLCSRIDENHNTKIWTEYRALIWGLITEDNVFCFKFVFLCFKEYREKCSLYRCHQIFSFKMVPTADIVYWTFHKPVSRYSNSQSTVHNTQWQLLFVASTQNNVGLLFIR